MVSFGEKEFVFRMVCKAFAQIKTVINFLLNLFKNNNFSADKTKQIMETFVKIF